ncbi:hypothetical protein JYK14_01965 [Siccirubricoccus sp. KC 17139]|uniref:Uncharacterized protein n=1 Tax=Siccirubricoccus soli TaxID=2899147 RepID=A0ABT1CZ60_9PROT|nr:hypothetical protein [Siccirubricoccus soli]MCO6414942.1 hypothetical protein [Siccirubricoccus soli]MCP2681073.1 hypothetical protein [Siccirubricoccus soli]
MAQQGPVYLRWRAGRPAPEQEEFPNLDAALDAVEARWETLQHQAPQLLDARRVLLLSTAELLAMAEEEETGAGKAG